MKRKFMWTRFAAVVALAATALTGPSYVVHAAPATCHQKITMAGMDYFSESLALSKKVNKQVKGLGLELLAADPSEYDAKTTIYLEAVFEASKLEATKETAKLMLTLYNEVTSKFKTLDGAYGNNPVLLDGTKKATIELATSAILTATFVCKNTDTNPKKQMVK